MDYTCWVEASVKVTAIDTYCNMLHKINMIQASYFKSIQQPKLDSSTQPIKITQDHTLYIDARVQNSSTALLWFRSYKQKR